MKKALIITYYWPPAGGPGVQRVVNIVENLDKFGWEPIVLTVENPSAPTKDKSLLSRIPPNCKIYETKTREPFKVYKKLTGKKADSALPKNISFGNKVSFSETLSRWIRANLFIPDARKAWKNFIVRDGLKIIKNEKPDIIFSTSPPHSLQLGAKKLAKLSKVPWVADLRDPWTEAYWEAQMPKTKKSQKTNRKYERSVLNAADEITTVGEGIKDLLQKKTVKPVSVIYNGYREINNTPLPAEYFEIMHLGNLSSMQSFSELLNAIEILDFENKKKIKLVFVGSIDDGHRQQAEQIKDLKKEYIGFLPYKEMVERARLASLFYLPRLDSEYSKGLISAKLFDYLALQRPILAIADEGSDIGKILDHTKSGQTFQAKNIKGIRDFIQTMLNNPGIQVQANSELSDYSINENVHKLSEIFNNYYHR